MSTRVAAVLFTFFFAAISPALAASCNATKCYVTQSGGTGTRDGSDWTKALSAADLVSGLNQTTPSSKLTRGSTYYFANGDFGSMAIDDVVSGTSWLKLYKATAENSGSIAGWQSAFAGQARFGGLIVATNYVEINGQVRDENVWNDDSKYGFKVSSAISVHWDNYRQESGTVPRLEGGDYVTIKYVSIGYPVGSSFSNSMSRGIGVVAGNGGKHDYIITHNYIHETREPVHFSGNCHHVLVDRNYIGPSWGKETVMALYGGWNFTVSNNIMIDNCQDVPNDDTANGCTTEVSGWSNSASDNFDNWQVYGNIIARKNAKGTSHTDAVIYGGATASVTGWRVYNNVIAGMNAAGLQRATININGAGNEVYNNIWYDIGPGANIGCSIDSGSSCSHNWCYTGTATACANLGANSVIGSGSPFVAGDSYRLSSGSSAMNVGKNLTGVAGFEGGLIDRFGTVRGTNGWDIGAYEFTSGDSAAPGAPSNLRISN